MARSKLADHSRARHLLWRRRVPAKILAPETRVFLHRQTSGHRRVARESELCRVAGIIECGMQTFSRLISPAAALAAVVFGRDLRERLATCRNAHYSDRMLDFAAQYEAFRRRDPAWDGWCSWRLKQRACITAPSARHEHHSQGMYAFIAVQLPQNTRIFDLASAAAQKRLHSVRHGRAPEPLSSVRWLSSRAVRLIGAISKHWPIASEWGRVTSAACSSSISMHRLYRWRAHFVSNAQSVCWTNAIFQFL